MKDLNDLLRQKAEAQLKSDIYAFLNGIRNSKLFTPIKHVQFTVDGKGLSMSDYLQSYGDHAANIIFEYFKADYIKATTEEFMNKVEAAYNDIEELRNQMPTG